MTDENMVYCGDIIIHMEAKYVLCGEKRYDMGGRRIPIVLGLLAASVNNIVPSRILCDAIFPSTQYDARHLLIDVIKRIRETLVYLGSKLVLKNVWNEGYMLEWPDIKPAYVRQFTERQMRAFRRVLDIADPTVPDLVAMLRGFE